MQRPKWLNGWGKEKNSFEGSLVVDIPDIKVVEASFDKRVFLIAVGTAQKRETRVSGVQSAEGMEGKFRTNLEWKIFYALTALPNSIPLDKAKDFMAGMVAVTSGSPSVYNTDTLYIASGNRPSKGNAPVLLDYEMATKIEEAKKSKKTKRI